MKTRLKVYGSVVLALVSVGMLIRYGYADLSALAWHLQHGFHVDVAGTRLRVPFSYEADEPAGLPSISLMRFPGLLWREGAFILFDFRGSSSPEKVEAAEALLKRTGNDPGITSTRAGERSATFVGRQGRCVEYNTKFPLSGSLKAYEITGFEIRCGFGTDVSATFMGPPGLRDDFYYIIESAKPLKAKD